MTTERFDIVVVGSGFGGSIVARCLRATGRRVALLESGAHPRFAIGESSTPLGNLTLERLAHRYGLPDLWELAQHGRWLRYHPGLRRGLKRGFTFYRHLPADPSGTPSDAPAVSLAVSLADDGLAERRLLVAASPDAEIADLHWMREDIDHHMVQQAEAEGVDYRDGVEVAAASRSKDGTMTVETTDGRTIEARFVIDATGARCVVADAMGISEHADALKTHSGFVGTHMEGLPLFSAFLAERGIALRAGPYPDDQAAVHHWLDEGWAYALRFDDGTTSVGLLLDGGLDAGLSPAEIWAGTLSHYPLLAEWLDRGRVCRPWLRSDRLQRIRGRAAGPGWAALPHAFAFVDPLFSTGIAWTLAGVERLVDLFDTAGGEPEAAGLARYDDLLQREARQIDRLVKGAYAARHDFALSTAHSMLYFAAVSWAESLQRLTPGPDDAWTGFLGVNDPLLASLPEDALGLLELVAQARHTAGEPLAAEGVGRFTRWVQDAIADRNVAGLADPTRDNLYPADLADLVRSAPLMGLTGTDVTERSLQLRGTERPKTRSGTT